MNRVENFTPSYTICHYSLFFGQILVVRSGDLFNIGRDSGCFGRFWGKNGRFSEILVVRMGSGEVVVLWVLVVWSGAGWCCICWSALIWVVVGGWLARSEILRVAQNDKTIGEALSYPYLQDAPLRKGPVL